jgi:hypothetical protein
LRENRSSFRKRQRDRSGERLAGFGEAQPPAERTLLQMRQNAADSNKLNSRCIPKPLNLQGWKPFFAYQYPIISRADQ